MSTQRYDVVISGAGPAGATASIRLARAGRRVALLDRRAFPATGLGVGWMNRKAKALLDELGTPLTQVLAYPFSEVVFHSADLAKSSSPRLKDPLGFLLDRTQFDNALVEAAAGAGVTVLGGHEMTGADLLEDRVVVHRDGAADVAARFFLLATGRGTQWLDRLKFTRHAAARAAWTGHVHTAAPPAPVAPKVGVILGLDRDGSFALTALSPDGMTVTLNWCGDKPQARPAFVQLCRGLFEKQLVPADLSSDAASAEIVFCPSSFALEMDTHVGKNTLVVGDAGGFVAALSHEGIYPAMWSARIAADVMLEAFDSRHTQDVLMTFESRWRGEMASYLSPPNTEMHYLLPMIFSNPAMADRMALAFFAGENL